MADLKTLETQIQTEWNAFRSFVALHPYTSMLIALVVGNAVGVFLKV